MKRKRKVSNNTIALLFFGLALLDVAYTGSWIKAFFWILFGVFILTEERLKKSV
jgi:hypothetical protein